jgi:hypothetical protein
MADELDEGTGHMRTKDIRKLADAWCKRHTLPPMSDYELFDNGMRKTQFQHDPNKGRPRYLGVKAKSKPRLVSVNNA